MKLTALTSLRFFAAALVFADHFFQLFHDSTNPLIKAFVKFSSEGLIGVGFFFVLSGFIISFSYDKNRGGSHNAAGQFLLRRFARLWPVHMLTLAFFTAWFTGGFEYFSVPTFLMNASLLQSWIPDTASYWGYNSVSWSLSCEAFFYVSFLGLVKLSTRWLSTVFAALIGVIAYTLMFKAGAMKDAIWMFYVNPAFRIVDFIAGMLVYRAFSVIGNPGQISRTTWTAIEFATLISLSAFVYYGVTSGLSGLWRVDTFYLAPMAAIVLVFAFGRGAISQAISNRFFMYLGEASFCLYMIHLTFNGIVFNAFRPDIDVNSGLVVFLTFGALLTGSVALACILFTFYEKPLNKFILARFSKKKIAAGGGVSGVL